MGGLSIWHWLIVLLVVVLIFGTKKLKDAGRDLGGLRRNGPGRLGAGAESEASPDRRRARRALLNRGRHGASGRLTATIVMLSEHVLLSEQPACPLGTTSVASTTVRYT